MKGVAALLVFVLIWTAGLFAFAARVQHSTPLPSPKPAEGIVVLTGANSNERIAAAVELLTEGLGRRVLVSGVNREVSREELRTASRTARSSVAARVAASMTSNHTTGEAPPPLATPGPHIT